MFRQLSLDDIEEVFTPGAPILRREFFVGRERELDDLKAAIRRRGYHPIITGDRGVGKTSLVRQAFSKSAAHAVFVGCNSEMTFDEFARNALRELGVEVAATEVAHESEAALSGGGKILGIGAEASGKTKTTRKVRALGTEKIDPWRFYLELRDLGQKGIVVLDEYDVVSATNKPFHRAVAELIKTLADHSHDCDTRIVIVGIGQSAQVLLGRHESIERSATEIHLNPLTATAVYAFLSSAEDELKVRFTPAVKDSLVETSSGYPYFVHLVGLECLAAMHRRDPNDRVVGEHDYKEAIDRAIRRAFRAELRKYSNAMRNLDELSMSVVREIASLGRRDRHVTEDELQKRVTFIMRVSASEVRTAFKQLHQSGLVYATSTNNYVRFRDPLLGPFIRAWMLPELGPEPNVRQLQLFGESEGTA